MQPQAISDELKFEYELRFGPLQEYRNRVWRVLTAEFFQRYIPRDGSVLDLGCGWGEFINNIKCSKKYGMDLNPAGFERLNDGVTFLHQNCAEKWHLPNHSLDIVFTSNFFEHLSNKSDLRSTMQEAYRALKPGGSIVCLGPNIKYLGGAYWDFWDHYLPLTELSLKEGLELCGFEVTKCVPKFLPYTMAQGWRPPVAFLKLYLKLPFIWPIFGGQFLVIARKPIKKPSL